MEDTASIFKFTPFTLWNKNDRKIFLYFFNWYNYRIWNTQSSNNSCEYKFLLSDSLSLLTNKLYLNFSKYLLDSLPRNLKSSFTTLRSQTSMWFLTEVDKVPLPGLPGLGETPWCSKTLTLKCLSIGLTNVGGCSAFARKFNRLI